MKKLILLITLILLSSLSYAAEMYGGMDAIDRDDPSIIADPPYAAVMKYGAINSTNDIDFVMIFTNNAGGAADIYFGCYYEAPAGYWNVRANSTVPCALADVSALQNCSGLGLSGCQIGDYLGWVVPGGVVPSIEAQGGEGNMLHYNGTYDPTYNNCYPGCPMGAGAASDRTFSVSAWGYAADTTPPNISLTSPSDDSTVFYKDKPFTFNATATDDSGIAWCAFYHNGSGTFELIENKSGITSGVEFSFDPINLARGTIIWNVECADDSSNQNPNWAPSNYTLFIDNTAPPQVETWIFPSTDPDHDNHNITFNWNAVTDADGDDVYYAFYLNDTLKQNTTDTNWTADFDHEGDYEYYVITYDGIEQGPASATRYFTLDTTLPSITWNYPFADNTTTSNQDLSLDVSCSDINLYQLLVNVTDSSGNEIYSNLSNATGTTLTAYDTIPLTDEDNYTVIVSCSDQHTSDVIPDYNVDKDVSEDKLSYDTGDNMVSISLKSSAINLDDFNTAKSKDRYKFTYDYSSVAEDATKRTFVFVLEAEHPLIYLEKSQYKAHFISNKNWIDFDLDDAEYDVKKISNYEYEISISTTKTVLDFNSIGGLNIVEEHASYTYEITAPTYTNNATNGSALTKTGETVYFNVTWFDEQPSHYVFCFGDGVSCVNETAQTYVSGQNISITKTVNAVHNDVVYWQFYANDTAGNWNNTPLASFTIANTIPTEPTSIVYTSPAVAYTDSLLTCEASGSSDADNEGITYYYEFKDTDDSTILQAFSADNTFDCDISGCDKGDTIYCHAKASDGYNYSSEGTAAGITIQNYVPTHSKPLLSSSSGTNHTNENLTCYNQSTYDADEEEVTNIYNWYKNNQSLTVLNMPFEINANDYSGYGNNCTISGANFTDGKIGKALSFDGVDDYIDVGNDNSLNLVDVITIEAWVKLPSTTGKYTIAGRGNIADQRYIFQVSDTEFEFFTGIHNANKHRSSGANLQPNTWYHLAAVYVDASDNLKFYKNGELVSNLTNDVAIQPNIGNFKIGSFPYGDINWFKGTIDEIKVYNRSLSKEQIYQNYLDTKDGFTSSRTIVSQETERYGDYICSITPNDGTEDGTTKNSTLTIKNYIPSPAPSLLNPADGYASGILPEFNWTESFDTVDNDDVYYIIQIDNNSDFSSIDYTNTSSEPRDANAVLDSTKIDTYYWRVLATDNIGNSSWSSTRTFTYASWNVTFNVTSGELTHDELNYANISYCNYTGFDQSGDTTNMYGPYEFPPGNWECTFEVENYYDQTQTFTADRDKMINVIMQKIGQLTDQEHTWLEALYNCIILKDCDLYDLLLEINQTVGNTWQHIKPTDESVITTETEISRTLSPTSNITYEYTVAIPIKAGYSLGAYLPVRIGFWFMNESNESCYSQGTLPAGVTVIEPYCNPLMVETIGPMGGSVDFRVDLRPNLTAGTYNVKRIIEIDPDNVWEGYGQEVIGQIIVTEDMTNPGDIGLDKTGETMPSTSGSSGGGGGGGSSPVTNIYQNITYITIQEADAGETEEKDGDEESSDETQETTKESGETKKGSGLAAITGNVIGNFVDGLSKGSPSVGIIIVLCIVIAGLAGYIQGSKKK